MSEPQEKSLQERVTRLEQEVTSLRHYNAELNHALANFGIKFPAAQTVNPALDQPPVQPWNYQTAAPGYFPPNFQGYTPQPQPATISQQAYAANYGPPAQLPIAPPPQGYSYPAAGPNSKPAKPDFDFLRSGEFWLNKIGIGLLLFGVAFLFTYAV